MTAAVEVVAATVVVALAELEDELEVEVEVEAELELELAAEAPPQVLPTPRTQSLLSRAAAWEPVRSMAAALAVAKRARTGRREYIVLKEWAVW